MQPDFQLRYSKEEIKRQEVSISVCVCVWGGGGGSCRAYVHMCMSVNCIYMGAYVQVLCFGVPCAFVLALYVFK